jgi:hypothetical protein
LKSTKKKKKKKPTGLLEEEKEEKEGKLLVLAIELQFHQTFIHKQKKKELLGQPKETTLTMNY